jgi:hypothetical protein
MKKSELLFCRYLIKAGNWKKLEPEVFYMDFHENSTNVKKHQ